MIIDEPAYSRGYKYFLYALIDISIKYYNINGKVIHADDIECIKEKILDFPTHELDSCIVHAVEQYVEYCQKHRFFKCSEEVESKHYEKLILVKGITEENDEIENLDWEK